MMDVDCSENSIETQAGLSYNSQKGILAWLKTLLAPRLGFPELFRRILRRRSFGEGGQIQDAQFVGWQKTPAGEVFALYSILSENSPLCHSTVSEKTLREQKLNIPRTPSPPPHLKQIIFDR